MSLKQHVRSLSFWLTLWACMPIFAAESRVDINRADAATLVKALDGVGPAKAAAIVEHRKTHGPFRSLDDLMQVKGIGPKTIERNRARIGMGGGLASADRPAGRGDIRPVCCHFSLVY